MIGLIQRVKSASVLVDGQTISKIAHGYLIFLGVANDDIKTDAEYLADKIENFRIFPDDKKNMNLSILDVKGSILVVSQFTLCANWQKGRRPSFTRSAKAEKAENLYRYFSKLLKDKKIPVQMGKFGAMMDVKLVNDGPVTFVMNSNDKKKA